MFFASKITAVLEKINTISCILGLTVWVDNWVVTEGLIFRTQISQNQSHS